MSSRPLSVDDVYRLLVERVRSGELPVGSKLPSVRNMADEFGSNPSTVDRAIHRLAQVGVLRTVPRQGTYVAATELPPSAGVDNPDTHLLDKALMGFRASGMSHKEARRVIDEALGAIYRDPKVAFVECNPVDLRQMAETLTNATGVDLTPVLLDELDEADIRQIDAFAVPLFHVSELRAKVGLDAPVVELNFHPTNQALAELANLDPSMRVVVSGPTERGLERMASLIHQYFFGEVDTHHSTEDEPAALSDFDAVVYTNAAQLDPEVTKRLPRAILIEWELDQGSSMTFLSRLGGLEHNLKAG